MSAKPIYTKTPEFEGAVKTYKELGSNSIRASQDQCILLARMQVKLAESVDGKVTSKEYKLAFRSLKNVTCGSQFRKDVQVGKYLIENQEKNPNLSSMTKTIIYKTYINPPKPKVQSMSKQSKDARIKELENRVKDQDSRIRILETDKEFFLGILDQIRSWADNKTRAKFEGILTDLGIDPKAIH